VLYGLGTGAVNEAHTYWSHIYHRQPSLKKSDNNILLVLIWSSITSDVARNFSEWAASDDGSNLRRRLLKDVQKSQTTEQLALTLTAWLCFQRLFPCSSDATQPIKGSFLADFDALLTGERLSNECTVLEHMIFSFSQALNNLGGDYQDTRQLLNAVLDTEILALEHPDRTLVQYSIYRTKKRLAHKAAKAWTHGFCILQNSKRFLAGVLAIVLSARHDLICQIQSFLCPTLWYYFSTAVSAVVLYARYNQISEIFDIQLTLPTVFFDILSYPWLVQFFFFRPVENSLLYPNLHMYATVPTNWIDGSYLSILLYLS